MNNIHMSKYGCNICVWISRLSSRDHLHHKYPRFKNPPLSVASKTLCLIIHVTIKVNECTNLCITKKYSLQIVASFRHIKISQSKTYKKMWRRCMSLWHRETISAEYKTKNRLCYMLAEERRTWNLFRVILMEPSSRFTLSRRFSKAAWGGTDEPSSTAARLRFNFQ